jgi:anthranilate/para-aminobenzoate synthase component II
MHGKTDLIAHDGTGLFAGLPQPLTMTRYHSLVAQDLPPPLRPTAYGSDGTIQALAHTLAPVYGVQFHPESIASEHGLQLLANFLTLSR